MTPEQRAAHNAHNREYMAQRNAARLAAGLCVQCGEPRGDAKRRCGKCQARAYRLAEAKKAGVKLKRKRAPDRVPDPTPKELAERVAEMKAKKLEAMRDGN